MKCVIQRVLSARLEVDGGERASFEGPGLVVLAGLEAADELADVEWCAEKIAHLRIFPDQAGKLNRSAIDLNAPILLVPNFTLAGEASRGRRPSFDRAMKPELASPLFDTLVDRVAAQGAVTHRGVFRAHMHVSLVNDGPVTILLDSHARARAADAGTAGAE